MSWISTRIGLQLRGDCVAADCVKDLVDNVLTSKMTWIDKDGIEQPITLRDILIIAPYNAQVYELQDRRPASVREACETSSKVHASNNF